MSDRFYCDTPQDTRDYCIFDLNKSDKTKEDYWNGEIYDTYEFREYLLNETDALLTSDEVTALLNEDNFKFEATTDYRDFNKDTLHITDKHITVRMEKNRLCIQVHFDGQVYNFFYRVMKEKGMEVWLKDLHTKKGNMTDQ